MLEMKKLTRLLRCGSMLISRGNDFLIEGIIVIEDGDNIPVNSYSLWKRMPTFIACYSHGATDSFLCIAYSCHDRFVQYARPAVQGPVANTLP